YDLLAQRFPSVAAVDARLARLAFLRGDPAGARDRAARASTEARNEGAFGPGLAWYAHLEAQVALDRGDYEAAAAHEEEALGAAPNYHISLAGLARARAAQGRTAEAIAGYEYAIGVSPQPDYLSALGDLHALAGDQGRARDQYAAVEAIATLAAANRQLYDRQLALFYADHDLKSADAVAIAKASLDRRADVYGHDAYAWALLKSGAPAEARASEERALAMGTPDARLWYHAGMISMALGEVDRARSELRRSLDISPNFDALQAARARTALASLVAAR
ncbi:MAG: tetratricopeptide repeat protein, partial [Chloroflexota bacterium]|nr:tetratricopeptide repeat protein [Chloroflexota bacterium]